LSEKIKKFISKKDIQTSKGERSCGYCGREEEEEIDG